MNEGSSHMAIYTPRWRRLRLILCWLFLTLGKEEGTLSWVEILAEIFLR